MWKIGQINIQTLSEDYKVHLALRECKRANLDVVCFQEVRLLKSGNIYHEGYNFYWNGLLRLKRYGVAIAIRKNSYITIENILLTSARLMAADISVRGCKIRIISCYAPTRKSPLSTKQLFYRNLSKLCKVEKHRKVLINGDFNAEPSFCRELSRFDGITTFFDNGNNQTDDNDMLFLQHCYANSLAIMNTWFNHPIHHRETWHSPDGVTKKVYDYCLAERWLTQNIIDVRVRNSYFHSVHRLVVTKLKTPANKAARSFTKKRYIKRSKPNFQLLQNNDTKGNVNNAIIDHLQQHNEIPNSIDDMHRKIIDALKKGRQQIPLVSRNNSTATPWIDDEELENLHCIRVDLRKKQRTNDVKKKLKEIAKKIKAKVRKIQNKQLKDKGASINEARQHRNAVKLWRLAKTHDSSMLAKAKALQCPGLADHFKKHFNPDQTALTIPTDIEHSPQFIEILRNLNAPMISNVPTANEIRDAICQLNNGKSTIDVEAEVAKCAVDIPEMIEALTAYYGEIWTTKNIPEKWKISRITAIWKKKGNANDPTKHRGISIGAILCKAGMNIILKRIANFYNTQLKRTQFGFRSGMGCNDGIFMIKQLQDIASLSERPLYVCFIDLTAAFDHVNRDLLFKTIRNRLSDDQNTVNIDIIENLYMDTKSYMQNEDPEYDSFPTKSGVRQGGQEGPPLYNLYSDYVMRVYEQRKINAGVVGLNISYHIPNEATNRAQRAVAPTSGVCDDDDCGYADDLVVICWTINELQTCINLLSQTFTEFGLTINEDKTETMIINHNNPDSYPKTIITLNGKHLTNTPSFKYLGVWISSDSLHIGQSELHHRINSAQNAFAQNRKLLTNRNIKLETRVLFLNALVRSRLTYGCHVWKPSATEMNRIESTYRYMLRSMIWNGHQRVNPPATHQGTSSDEAPSDEGDEDDVDWRYVITNHQLYNITETENILHYHKVQRTNWVSHIIRRSNNNICKILLFHTIKRTKLGRKTPSLLEQTVADSGMTYNEFIHKSFTKEK